PEAAIPGAYNYAQRAWFDGIGATGRAWDMPVIVEQAPEGAGSWLGRTRANLSAHIASRLAGSEGGVATAFVTGDRGGISEADAEAMRRSGLAHLLSISGLHVTAVVAATMLLVLKLLALSPRLALHAPLLLIAAGAAALAGVGYTLLSGAEVPTIRSCIAALLVLAGIALGRDAITLRLVATGAIVVLLLWPESVVGPSFQLSFAAVTAIVALHEHPRAKALLSRRDESILAKLGRFGLGLLLTGIVVEIVLMPIALYHFHQAGLYGALANIAAIPLTTFVIMPLEALALLLDIAGLGAPVWWLAGQAIGLLLDIAHAVSSAPGAVARLPSMPALAFALIVAGGLWLCLWRTRWRLAGAIPALIGALWALATPPPDILVNNDGRHMALRTEEQRLVVLRPRAGEYIRDTFNEGSGLEAEIGALDELPQAICGDDSCRAVIVRGDRRWRIFATRSRHYLPWPAMIAECAASDIVISSRTLPETCQPRELKADRRLLARTGGMAITLGDNLRVVTVRAPGDDHPWVRALAR
ncbi:MAG: ComEC/Rec2 family competence protein, partial [Sphingomonadaceae bacterium]|nr:ComEC/Rec2 family competence protein [Sphingomonadaceae bacterium]